MKMQYFNESNILSNSHYLLIICRLIFRVPQKLGLIAIAVQQTQGKGKFVVIWRKGIQ